MLQDIEAMPLKVGIKVRDNDPRMLDVPNRDMIIQHEGDGVVTLMHPSGEFTMRINAGDIFTDDKVRKNGWSVVS